MILIGRSIWQEPEEKPLLKNAGRSLSFVLNTAAIIKEPPPFISYHQVYEWVRKYDAKGEDALADRRGHHKSDDEVDELERLRRENLRLKRQLEEKDMLVELLKKVKEFEGM